MVESPFSKKQPDLDRPYHYFDTALVPAEARVVKVMGVDYVHIRTRDGGDLYVTEYGLPFLELVKPDHWYYDPERKKDRERLNGSGTLYRVRNRDTGKGKIDLVIKWSRVAQDVPGRTPLTLDEMGNVEFNTPFEEFGLLMEMRDSRYESPGAIHTHLPLAIYTPAERVEPERLGRRAYKMQSKTRNLEIELDLYRQYIVIYQWVRGVDLMHFSRRAGMTQEKLDELSGMAERDMAAKGFRDYDRKPNHIIVRPGDGGELKKSRDAGKPLYAFVDFEMLRRTAERERWVKESKRAEYLVRQRDRFIPSPSKALPPHLRLVNILGVDYVYGRVESTGGALWVVGRDPFLFDYFLPERWRRTPRRKLSQLNELYHTTTKDDIHVVWKVSRVGEKPEFFQREGNHETVALHGYNSPFEEFSFALELSRKGVPTIYPRAIYRTGYEMTASEYIADNRRYETHRGIVMPDGITALQRGFNYIIVWGYWNGPDELLAVRDGEFYSGINLFQARNGNIISREMYDGFMSRQKSKLADASFEDINLRAEHFMISVDNQGKLITDPQGGPEIRCGNFEFMKHL